MSKGKLGTHIVCACIIGAASAMFLYPQITFAEDNNSIGNGHEDSLSDGFKITSVTLSTMVKSQYLSAFNGGVCSKESVLHSDLYTTFKNGLYIDVWHSIGLQSKWDSGFDDEIDLSIGRAGKLGDSGFTYDIGLCYFNCFPVKKWGDKGDVLELYTEWSIADPWKINSNNTIAPYFRTETVWSPYSNLVKGETLASLGLRHSLMINQEWSIKDKVWLLYDPGVFGLDSGFLAIGEAQIDCKVSKNLTLNLIWVRYSAPFGVHDSRNWDTAVGAGATYNF
jgi:hypothetical protein